MPVTKRLAHLGSPKNLIEYILDEKNDGEKVGLASSLNCCVETALYEFRDIQKNTKWVELGEPIILSKVFLQKIKLL